MDSRERCCEAEARRILRELRRNRRLGVFLIILCAVYFGAAWQLFGGAPAVSPEARLAGEAVYTTGVGLLVRAGVCLARAKGRSGAWGLLGLGCLFGLIGLRFLPSRCLHCGRLESSRSLHFPDCRAPL